MPTISIVIPNWNGDGKLQVHLPNVLKAAGVGKVQEVIIVDDASSDKSVDIIKAQFPEIMLIEKKVNSGFSSTVNLGVSKAKGDLIVLLNNDASPEVDFLESLMPHFKDNRVFSVGCNVGGLWATAKFENGFFWHNQATENPNKSTSHETLWVSGGSGIFRKAMWDQLEGLDTLYNPFYEEDVDLGYRALKRGYLNIWESRSRVMHSQKKELGVIATNFSKSKIASVAQRNQLIFIWKNITSSEFISTHKKVLAKILITDPKYWQVFLSAAIKLPEITKKRAIEIKQSKLSDEQVLSAI